MDEISFTYYCPRCGEGFIGEMPCDQETYADLITCEDCGHRYTLNVRVDIIVTTE